jgi:hypothetical protein
LLLLLLLLLAFFNVFSLGTPPITAQINTTDPNPQQCTQHHPQKKRITNVSIRVFFSQPSLP